VIEVSDAVSTLTLKFTVTDAHAAIFHRLPESVLLTLSYHIVLGEMLPAIYVIPDGITSENLTLYAPKADEFVITTL
jgi:hypothetical protein